MTLLEVSKTGSDRSVHLKITVNELCIILAALKVVAPEWKKCGSAEKTLRSHTEKVFNQVEDIFRGLAETKKKRPSVPNKMVYYSGH